MAFFWAFVFGAVFGAAVWFRVDRAEAEGDVRWHVAVRLWLERLEWSAYDWRVRELGAEASPSEQVVIVAVDDETLANAREAERPVWAMRPWPRELTGAVVGQIAREGAAVVLLDKSMPDVSPHFCAPCRADRARTDDQRLADALAKVPGKVVLTWDWQAQPRPEADRPLTPFLVRVAQGPDEASLLGAVRQVLELRLPAYLLEEGGQRAVWAGVPSEARGRELTADFEVRSPLIRPRTPDDDEKERGRDWLAVRLAQVTVKGLDPERLLRARAVDAPVAPLLSLQNRGGAASMIPDADGRVRGLPLLLSVAEPGRGARVVASAVLLTAMQALGVTELSYDGAALHLGDKASVPMEPNGLTWLAWDGAEVLRPERGTVKRAVPAWRLAVNGEDDAAGRGIRHHDNELAGKVVVFTDQRGVGGGRAVQTPVGEVSRAAFHAQALANLLRSRGISRVDPKVDLWMTLSFAMLGALLAMAWSSVVRRPGWLAWVVTLALIAMVDAFLARRVFLEQHRWLAMAAPMLACSLTFLASLGYAHTLEQGFREFVLRALGGAVRADIFRRVESDLLLMRPERRDLTVYYSDLEGFTAAAQVGEPRETVAVLQDYLSAMTQVVLDRGGHVDKYLGDGLMAFWGAPVEIDRQVAVGCDSALALRDAFEKQRAAWEKRIGRPVVMRAGLDHGTTVVGEMGTLHRVNYTVLGGPVATCFRLEALAKRYDVRILVGAAVPTAAGDGFLFREVDTVRLGKTGGPVKIHELVGRVEELERLQPRLDGWATAMKAFRARDFAAALEAFRAYDEEGKDALANRYCARCVRFLERPPPADWDGSCDDVHLAPDPLGEG